MKEKDSIAKIAELFHIAPSALRYWDEQKLVRFERDSENNYRYPTFQTMMDICETVLYRSCSIPIRDIRSLARLDTDGWQQMLTNNEQKLNLQIAELQESIQKIQLKKRMLSRLDALKKAPFSIKRCVLPAIQPFSFDDGEAVRAFVFDSHKSAILLDADFGSPPKYGLFTEQQNVPLLREQDADEVPYLVGLLRVDAECDRLRNDASFAQEAEKAGFRPGGIVGRYLVSACEGKRYDFYEGWMQLL